MLIYVEVDDCLHCAEFMEPQIILRTPFAVAEEAATLQTFPIVAARNCVMKSTLPPVSLKLQDRGAIEPLYCVRQVQVTAILHRQIVICPLSFDVTRLDVGESGLSCHALVEDGLHLSWRLRCPSGYWGRE